MDGIKHNLMRNEVKWNMTARVSASFWRGGWKRLGNEVQFDQRSAKCSNVPNGGRRQKVKEMSRRLAQKKQLSFPWVQWVSDSVLGIGTDIWLEYSNSTCIVLWYRHNNTTPMPVEYLCVWQFCSISVYSAVELALEKHAEECSNNRASVENKQTNKKIKVIP